VTTDLLGYSGKRVVVMGCYSSRFISGVCLPVDAGLADALVTGALNLPNLIAEAAAEVG
jgi:hypothetical protein